MSKNISLLDSIKAKMVAEAAPVAAIARDRPSTLEGKGQKPDSQEPRDISTILTEGGFDQLFNELEGARDNLELDRKIVYIDDESAEVLELLRKKAKIKSSLLVSCLLQEFFRKHKGIIQQLIEKKKNKLIE